MKRYFISTCLAVATVVTGLGCSPTQNVTLVAAVDPRDEFMNSGSIERLAHTLNSLLKDASSERLEELKNDANLTIALGAAYRLCQKPGPSNMIPRPQRFLGFMEGRAHLRIPVRWEVELSSHLFGNRPDLAVAAMEDYRPIAPFLERRGNTFLINPDADHLTDVGGRAPIGTDLDRYDGKVVLSMGNKKVSISKDALPKFEAYTPPLAHCAVILGSKRSFLAFYDQLANPYPLVCVDSRSGEVLWREMVWAMGFTRAIAGTAVHNMNMNLTGGAISIFGDRPSGVYAESFDVENGTNIFRFSTNSWHVAQYEKAAASAAPRLMAPYRQDHPYLESRFW
jgi:hypothetical protein